MAEQPIDTTRQTPDGLVRIVVDREGGKWRASIKGPAIEAMRHFGTAAEANAWAREAFRDMFPDVG